MPGARWFPGAQVNYAREVLRHTDAAHAAGMPAIVSDNELGEVRELSWPEMRRQVAAVALTLKSLGVKRGDRVAAYMPNVPETMVAFLACSSIGAIWSVCAPDMGTAAVADRFRQIEPTLLIAVDGVHYGGKPLDRSAVLQELRDQLPSVRRLLLVPSPHAASPVAHDVDWTGATARDDAEVAAFEPEWLPFDHPIWIVYSSGTTGLPKPIVHGQGGILLTMHACGLHNDVGASYGVGQRNEPRGEQRPARSPFVLCVSDSRLSACAGRALRGCDGCRQAGGRAQSVPTWAPAACLARVIFLQRRAPGRRRIVYDGRRSAATAIPDTNLRRSTRSAITCSAGI